MRFISHLSIKVLAGQREAALSAYKSRRVLEECSVAIPGFIEAQLMLSEDCPDTFCVAVTWSKANDYQDWLAHPARAKQGEDLAEWVVQPPETRLFQGLD